MARNVDAITGGMLWLLLGSLVLLQFGYPVTSYGPGWTGVYLLVYIGVIAFGVRRVAASPRRHWPIAVAVILFLVSAVWSQIQQENEAATIAMLAAIGVLQLALLTTLLGALLKPTPTTTTTDLILIAVSAYLLFGGVFGVLASQLEFASPGSYADGSVEGPVTWQTLFYGSYVTLATLGYGDILPVSEWARSLSSLEAVMGTLFLAIVIAQLVSSGARWRKRADATQ